MKLPVKFFFTFRIVILSFILTSLMVAILLWSFAPHKFVAAGEEWRESMTEVFNQNLKAVDDAIDATGRRADALLWIWNGFKLGPVTSMSFTKVAQKSIRFIPISDWDPSDDKRKSAKEAMLIYSNVAQKRRSGSFLIIPGVGIVTNKISATQQQVLVELVNKSLKDKSAGVFLENSCPTYEFAVIRCNDDGSALSGQFIDFNDIFDLDLYSLIGNKLSAMMFNEEGERIWSDRYVLNNSDLKERYCGDFLTFLDSGKMVFCSLLKGKPWHFMMIAPSYQMNGKAFYIIINEKNLQMVFLISLLSFLLLALFCILLRYLYVFFCYLKVKDSKEERQDKLTIDNVTTDNITDADSHGNQKEHIATVSHELRTPLNSIMGALELILRSPLPQEQQELAKMAQQSSKYLLNMVNNILDFRRIELGQMALACEKIALLPILDQVMLNVHLEARKKGLNISTFVAEGVPHYIVVDALRLQQILINFVNNAVKYTESGFVHLVVECRGEQLAFIIRDSGKGIPSHYLTSVFKPYVQINSHDKGSGLGLAIALNLAKLMRGEVKMQSEAGVGSNFILLLPIHSGEPGTPFSGSIVAPTVLHAQLRAWGFVVEEGENERLCMPELSYLPARLWSILSNNEVDWGCMEVNASIKESLWSLKVLIVDDIDANRNILGRMVSELGHQPYFAETGKQALNMGRVQIFDVVLMDIYMRDLNGIETACIWRDPQQGTLDSGTPIMALTANVQPLIQQQAQEAGMQGFLTKPINLFQLADVFQRVVALQLARGIEVEPNTTHSCALSLDDETVTAQLYSALMMLHLEIVDAVQKSDTAAMLHALHSLKGCAGQGGIESVRLQAEKMESELRQGIAIEPEMLDRMAVNIRAAFEQYC
ncbi:hypothetical protein CIG19_14655 [Enterobacterales bacterium CwR94]|nr:hypothetical protein CIG19_14655 [Enterobacterales bacterium CwR94]